MASRRHAPRARRRTRAGWRRRGRWSACGSSVRLTLSPCNSSLFVPCEDFSSVRKALAARHLTRHDALAPLAPRLLVNSSSGLPVMTTERIDSGDGRSSGSRAVVEQLNQEEHSMSKTRIVAMFVAAAFSVWTVGSAVTQAPAPAAKPAETKPADPAKPAMESKPADKPVEKSATK